MIDFECVSSAYSGKRGCMCGCRGKYTYTSKHRDRAGLARGYEVTPDEVSDRGARTKVNRMEALLQNPDMVEKVYLDDEYVAVDTVDGRTYAAYFRG